MNALLVFLSASPVFAAQNPPAPHPLFDGDAVHVVHLTFPQANWYALLQQNFEGLAQPILAPAAFDWDGVHFDTIGVRFKGQSSYIGYPGDKKSFKLDLNEFVSGQRLHGIDKLNLNNVFHDPSFVREKVFYELAAAAGLAAPRANFAALYVNDVYFGLYSLVEQVDEEFVTARFGANEHGNLWKGEPVGSLEYQGPNAIDYQDDYELETNAAANDWTGLIDLCDRLVNTPAAALPAALAPVLDLYSALAYLGVCSLTATLDSYAGRAHNLYFYRRDVDGRFSVVPWDVNESFGAYPLTYTVAELEQLDPEWLLPPAARHPLADRLWNDVSWRRIHRGHMRRLMNGAAEPNRLVARMDQLRALVRPYVLGDTKKMYTNAQFESAMSVDVDVGTAGVVPALETFVRHRHAFLAATIGATPPLVDVRIGEVATSPGGLALDEHGESEPWIEVVNTGSQSVDLAGTRLLIELSGGPPAFVFGPLVLAPGARVVVWCDATPAQGALHAPFTFAAAPVTVHLVSDDSVIDVARAPLLAANQSLGRIPDGTGPFRVLSSPTPGAPNVLRLPPVLRVNEFLASNQATNVDEAGEFEDWVEIYNPNAFAVPLLGWHLTDDLQNPAKWTFPSVTIGAGGRTLVWCDNEPNEGPLHATWKLSATGEAVGLSAPAAYGNVFVDTRSFGPQTNDVSLGRAPDGGATWASFAPPTPLAMNGAPAPVAWVTPYGIGKLTSTSTLPALAWEGTPSLTVNDFRVRVIDARPNSLGLAFHGAQRAAVPFANATRWVAAPLVRMPIRSLDPAGRAEYAIQVAPALVGTKRCWQFWFRDLGQTDGTNACLSGALEAAFGP